MSNLIQYNVIYADPPWTYKDQAQAGKRGVGFKYKTLTKAALKALPVQKLAKPDCALFLRTLWPSWRPGGSSSGRWRS